MCRKEQDAVGIHFDMENDDDVSPVRRIKLKTEHKSMADVGSGNLAVFAQLWSAGGDWQNPLVISDVKLKNIIIGDQNSFIFPKKIKAMLILSPAQKKVNLQQETTMMMNI